MADQAASSNAQRGFTVVELVVVIVIVAILGAIAMPRFAGNQAFAERGYYEGLATGLKFAQKYAVATGCPVRVRIDAAGYEARQQQVGAGRCDPTDGTWPLPVVLADGAPLAGTTPSGVTVAPNVTVIFDALGRSDLPGDQVVTVGPFALTIQAESGYVVAP